MLPAPMKSFLKSTAIYKRVSRHFRVGTIDRVEFLRGFINGNGWIFSQPKSGTNLVCSTIAFYNAEMLGLSDYSFGDRYRLGLIHGSRISFETIGDFNEFRLKSSVPVFVRTHDDIPGVRPKFLINITRGVLDNFVSVWHFSWQPRGFSVADSIAPMVDDFTAIHKAQKRASKRAEQTVVLRYEDLKEDPVNAFTGLFNLVFGKTDQRALSVALAEAAPERFKAWEKEFGAFVPEATKRFRGSFIRSGKIGEGAEFFSEEQKKKISVLLEKHGLIDDPDVVL